MTKKHIIVDPVTRIEGHLRIEAVLDENNVITEAYSAGTMFRGIETILKGRDPRDCGLLTMRICGVCTGTHYQRSIEAVEHAFEITIPKNARLVRNLIQGALYMHDHPVHFYNLHGLDWVDITSALKADPAKAAAEALKWCDTPYNASVGHYRKVAQRLTKFVKQGRLGPFANAYWENKSYKLSPEQNLVAASHYLDCLDVQRDIAKMHAIFGGKSPHPQSIVVGGVTCVQDIINPARVAEFKSILNKTLDFVKHAYIPDVLMAGTVYADEALAGIGKGVGNFLSYGDFNLDDLPFYESKKLFPAGVVYDFDISKCYDLDQLKITEDVTHAWYKGSEQLHPFKGKTEPEYTGYRKGEDGFAYLKTEGKYSWSKTPLYEDRVMEVGPLARMVIGVAKGDPLITEYVQGFLKRGNLPVKVLFSTVGRTAARAIETVMMGEEMLKWCDELAANVASGDQETWTKFDFDRVSRDAEGFGMAEAPRGGLGHWVKIKNGQVEHYQIVVPSTWNSAPRSHKGDRGPYEEALIGVKLSDPKQPLEILRTVHSFDPCIACAIHLVDTKGKTLAEYKVSGACDV